MNSKILQKCVEELKKDTYSKEYVLGMLETLIEMQSTPTYPVSTYVSPAPDQVIADLVNPVITGFKDLIPQENEPKRAIESDYLRGGLGKI